MSLQWTFIATFLYTEIFITTLLLLPFISAYRWSRIFNSRLLNSFRSHANIYFNLFIFVLLVLFFDAIRDTRKYSSEHNVHAHDRSEVSHTVSTLSDMKMFRAQRNLYISGFALFLWMVLRRLVTLLCDKATNEAQVEALRKQAESASAAARKLIEDAENKENEKEEKSAEAGELETTKDELKKARDEVARVKKDLEAMKKQAESTNKEYDRLAEENRSLQQNVETLKGETGGKKDK